MTLRCGNNLAGREAFVAKVYTWVDTYGGKICAQLRRLGTSPDWSRQAFTMDANLSTAVKVFQPLPASPSSCQLKRLNAN